MPKIVVTGAGGLIGWHAWARLYAANCAARFQNQPTPHDLVRLDHAGFEDDATLHAALQKADAVLHFAGVNRAENDNIVEAANPAIATRLVESCKTVGVMPHIVYANSIHALSDTPYGRSKRLAGEILAAAGPFTNLILPHVFGEGARPDYNNVTATFIAKILKGEEIILNPDGQVQLLHAGDAAKAAIDAIKLVLTGEMRPAPRPMSVPDLLKKLQGFHALYQANIYPNLTDPFDLALFNSYRVASYPENWPRPLKLHTDARGTLFEAVKGGSSGQTFLSRSSGFWWCKVKR